MITAITCTGDRPVAFDLCRRWMVEQSVKPDRWIVVDDGKLPIGCNPVPDYLLSGGNEICFLRYVRRDPQPTDPKHTLGLNLRAALPFIQGDAIFFIEDDEYYAPAYIETMMKFLGMGPDRKIVGVGCSKYYHLPAGKFHKHSNFDHASLAQTAIDKSLLSVLEDCIAGDPFIDVRLWAHAMRNKIGFVFDDDARHGSLYCGVKGLPGRKGIGVGHNPAIDCYRLDPGYTVFKKWVHTPEPYFALLKKQTAPELHRAAAGA